MQIDSATNAQNDKEGVNEMKDKDTVVLKRGWVKNAAIIFLAVMVIFAFTSNHIMNRTLPEVATHFVEQGTITARVRGGGIVQANESFDVTVAQTRRVSEVHVRLHDEIDIGDVLITFADDGNEALEEAQEILRGLEFELEEKLLRSTMPDSPANTAIQAARNALADAEAARNRIPYSTVAFNAAQTADNRAQAERRSAESAANTTQFAYDIASAELENLRRIIESGGTVDPTVLQQAEDAYNNAAHANDLAQATLSSAERDAAITAAEYSTQQENRREWNSANTAVQSAQLALTDAINNHTFDQTTAGVGSAIDDLYIRELMQDIEDQRIVIENLEQEGTGSEITSLVGGIVTFVDISPNEYASPENPLLIIEVVDRGYSLSFPVTAEQANRVNVGEQAEVHMDFWSPEDPPIATLTNIRPNPENPVTERLLHFAITGNAESGLHLNLIMNQRSETFDIVVPNSAVRSDTNGDFVLILTSRTSPLGNRFYATRADIIILATDDTRTAVTGNLSRTDIVITTSNFPVDPGMQVRQVDNP